MTMKKFIIALALVAMLSPAVQAESYGKPCTSVGKDKWLTLEAIEKIVTEHGYTVAKSKIKETCAEVYARDAAGTRVELFIDPATGKPAGSDWPAKATKDNAS